jgi:hypothetical protein
MTAKPFGYLNLDHDRLAIIAIVAVVSLVTSEIVILLLVYGSLCQKLRIKQIEQLYDIKLEIDIVRMPPVMVIHVFSLLLPQAAYQFIRFKKKIINFR